MAIEPSSIPIIIRGRYFWRGDARFFVRGVVYQPQKNNPQPGEVNDPIADDRIHELERNVSLLTELGINTLFIYFIDSQKPHDKAMKLLEQAGIYVVAVSISALPFNIDVGGKRWHRNRGLQMQTALRTDYQKAKWFSKQVTCSLRACTPSCFPWTTCLRGKLSCNLMAGDEPLSAH